MKLVMKEDSRKRAITIHIYRSMIQTFALKEKRQYLTDPTLPLGGDHKSTHERAL